MEDNELFTLCKQVYEMTKLGRMDNSSSTDEYYKANPVQSSLDKPDVIKGWQVWRWEDFRESGRLHYYLGKGQAYPKYTSDYLLEKLPKMFVGDHGDGEGEFWLALFPEKDRWTACYPLDSDEYHIRNSVHSDTPLKALLKLVLALKADNKL